LLDAMRDLEAAAARELGQIVKHAKLDVDVNAKVQTVSATLAELCTPQELDAMRRRLLAKQQAPAAIETTATPVVEDSPK
jgi:hypothetical protein